MTSSTLSRYYVEVITTTGDTDNVYYTCHPKDCVKVAKKIVDELTHILQYRIGSIR